MTTPPPDPTPALPQRLEGGTLVGRYEIDGWLRDGGMASLYRGHHAKTGVKVAIKVQLGRGAGDHVSAARFEREGQVMGRLGGVPHVVQVHDVGELPDGRRYLVMEWIAGEDLEERLDDLRNADRRIEIERVCRIMKDVALALVAVHRAGVVHRDLKPSNIMIDHGHPEREVAKLLDFGISAELSRAEGSVDLTAAGVVLGTPGYVAPEQALGLPAHPSFDVYAFGVVLFEALTGHGPPPDGLVPERLPAIDTLRAKIPPELAALVTACLQRDPSQRPPSAQALVERLDAVIDGLRRASGPGAHERGAEAAVVSRPRRRRAGMVVAVGILGVLVIVGWMQWRCGGSDPGGADGPHARVGVDDGATTAASAVEGSTSAGSASPGSMDHAEAGGTSPSTSASRQSTGEPDPEPDSSTTDGGLTRPSSGDGGASTGPNEPRVDVASETCKSARRRAEAARKGREWKAVLRASADRRCWDAPDHRNERRALRVEALAELERYEECVTEGTGSTDPRVARRTKLCRMRMKEQP